MIRIIGLLVIALPLSAQITVRYSPDSLSTVTAQVANARSMGPWLVMWCNDGLQPRTLAWERVAMETDIRFIEPERAALVLASNVRRSTASRLLVALRYAGAAASIALAVNSRANLAWSTGIGVGTSAIPDVAALIQGAVPNAAPLLSQKKWPVSVAPGECDRDMWFANKMPNPQPRTAVIP